MTPKSILLKTSSILFISLAGSQAMALEPTAEMGGGLYNQQGANSCLYCHGADGKGGKVAAAAKLDNPKNWKGYKALGGDAAFAKDKAGFLKNLKDATVHLIVKGAIIHNSTYKNPAFDWKKTGGPYDAQMLGVSGAPSKAWLNKYKDRGVTPQVAAESVYLYLQKFDTQKVFK